MKVTTCVLPLYCLLITSGYSFLVAPVLLSVRNKVSSKVGKVSNNFVLNLSADPIMVRSFTDAVTVNSGLALLLTAVKQKSLTKIGLLHATILGIGLWTYLGFGGWITCVSYLIMGSAVTKVRMKEKERLGIAEKRGGARGPENVWGSAATAMVCAILTYILPSSFGPPLKVGYVASLATKLSDTFGSEIGKAFGKNTYLITTMRTVPRGTEGAVSVEGTLAGVVGSIILSYIAAYLGLINFKTDIITCIFAAFVATTAESFIGAVFQSDKYLWLTNELVNLINTIIGAVTAILLKVFINN